MSDHCDTAARLVLPFETERDFANYTLYGTFPDSWSEELKAEVTRRSLDAVAGVHGRSRIERLMEETG